MRALIIFVLTAYATAAPQYLEGAAKVTSLASKTSEIGNPKNAIITGPRRFARSAGDVESTTDNVNEGVSEANDLAQKLADEERRAEEEASLAAQKLADEAWRAEEEAGLAAQEEGLAALEEQLAADEVRQLAEKARWEAEQLKLQEDESTDGIETTTYSDKEEESESSESDAETEQLTEEAHWAAEETKWQEPDEADASSDTSEITIISENENEGVEESNDVTNEIAEKALWAAEEKKWQEFTNSDTAAAVLDGIAASKAEEQSHTDEEANDTVILDSGSENEIDSTRSEAFNPLYSRLTFVPNYNYLSRPSTEEQNKPWFYQPSKVYVYAYNI